MCSSISRFANETIYPIAEEAVRQVRHAHDEVVHGVQWLGRKIHDLTHAYLPRRVAIIAEAAIKSLPFAAISLFLPIEAGFATFGAVVIYKMITVPRGHRVTAPTFVNGLGFSSLCRGIAQGCLGGPANVAVGVFHVAKALIFFTGSGLINEIANPTPVQQ